MRILIACPVPPHEIAGPATVARELAKVFGAEGDEVTFITLSPFEKRLPIGIRQIALFIRALSKVRRVDGVLLLDPASTGPALALAAHLLKRSSVLRVGGDFLWESYVERTQEPILLSEFYAAPRSLSIREKLIKAATVRTLRLASVLVFTTAWQRDLWKVPYQLSESRLRVVPPTLAPRTLHEATGQVFLAAHRGMRIKNGAVMQSVWEQVVAVHPEAVLDRRMRTSEEYQRALADCYAVIVPSLSEVSPNAVLEAIAYGKPFIATRDTGVREELSELGLFVDTRDPNAIAEAVNALLTPEVYRQFTARIAAFDTVRSWPDVAKELRAALVS